MIRAAGYGSAGTPIVEIASLWHISDQVHIGVQVFNPSGGKYGKQQQEKWPGFTKWGAGMKFLKNYWSALILLRPKKSR
ncbi:hypothetical protein [Paraflavitalea speifideaquila]|uniref:hypothetical protein n=1 Tax=Paraflavitalea speifideaquila TaxID=3076558 RepID=UPI0028E24162|nr:hypothetical protein [Paraflavitalea speifideiaquila]